MSGVRGPSEADQCPLVLLLKYADVGLLCCSGGGVGGVEVTMPLSALSEVC